MAILQNKIATTEAAVRAGKKNKTGNARIA
jgi:hypothetical protein